MYSLKKKEDEELKESILRLIEENSEISQNIIADKTGKNISKIKRIMSEMKKAGIIKKDKGWHVIENEYICPMYFNDNYEKIMRLNWKNLDGKERNKRLRFMLDIGKIKRIIYGNKIFVPSIEYKKLFSMETPICVGDTDNLDDVLSNIFENYNDSEKYLKIDGFPVSMSIIKDWQDSFFEVQKNYLDKKCRDKSWSLIKKSIIGIVNDYGCNYYKLEYLKILSIMYHNEYNKDIDEKIKEFLIKMSNDIFEKIADYDYNCINCMIQDEDDIRIKAILFAVISLDAEW